MRLSDLSDEKKYCHNMKRPVYLDYNGTTPLDPSVIDAMRPFFEGEFGNPSSSHWYGIVPSQAVAKARRQVAALLHCSPDEIVFTSGGTESNNHAIKGVAFACRTRGNHIITSSIEHPAVLEVCRFLEGFGFKITCLPVDQYGLVNPRDVEEAVRPETVLITVMHANNETGTVQPIAEIAHIARKNGIIMHTDAAQSAGKIRTDVSELGVDLLSLAGHKLYAPKGVGALYIRSSLSIKNLFHGAGQERGLRAGTENVSGIAALGKACEIAADTLELSARQMHFLRDRLYQGLRQKIDNMQWNGHPQQSLPNTLNISFRNRDANRILEEIGLEVAASAGAACHSNTVHISHVLKAMNIEEEWARGTIRFSVGRMTTLQEIDQAVQAVVRAVEQSSRQPK